LQDYRIITDQNKFDFKIIHEFLATSYWAKGIPAETLTKAISNSLCFAVFNATNEQVGFARMVTDRATYAYLADVFIIEEYRGKGLSKWLMEEILDHPDLQGLRRLSLVTKDAHGLYKQFGFKALSSPDGYMEVVNTDIYKNT